MFKIANKSTLSSKAGVDSAQVTDYKNDKNFIHEAYYKALQGDNRELKRLYQEKIISVDHETIYGNPLIFAVKIGDANLVNFLLEAGVLPNIKDEYGITPLQWAEFINNYDIATLLLTYGAATIGINYTHLFYKELEDSPLFPNQPLLDYFSFSNFQSYQPLHDESDYLLQLNSSDVKDMNNEPKKVEKWKWKNETNSISLSNNKVEKRKYIKKKNYNNALHKTQNDKENITPNLNLTLLEPKNGNKTILELSALGALRGKNDISSQNASFSLKSFVDSKVEVNRDWQRYTFSWKNCNSYNNNSNLVDYTKLTHEVAGRKNGNNISTVFSAYNIQYGNEISVSEKSSVCFKMNLSNLSIANSLQITLNKDLRTDVANGDYCIEKSYQKDDINFFQRSALNKVKRLTDRSKSLKDFKQFEKECKMCGTKSTPQWRRGPNGLVSLCNKCGLRYSHSTNKEFINYQRRRQYARRKLRKFIETIQQFS
jgi:hypothetical protein